MAENARAFLEKTAEKQAEFHRRLRNSLAEFTYLSKTYQSNDKNQ